MRWIKRKAAVFALLALLVSTLTNSVVQAQNPQPTPAATAQPTMALPADLTAVQPLTNLPPYILLVAQRTMPGAQFSGFRWALSDTLRPLYEVEGVQANQPVAITLFIDGTLDRIHRTIPVSAVPVDVIGMLDNYVRDFEISRATEALLANGGRRFEFAGRSGSVMLAVEITDSANQIHIMELQ